MLRLRLLELTAEMVSCDWVSFNELPLVLGGSAYSICGKGAPEQLSGLLPALYAHIHAHPIYVQFRKGGLVGAYVFGDFVSREEFEQNPLYNEYYRHTGAVDQLVLFLQHDRRFHRTISLNRLKGRFSERDRKIMNRLLPHFEQAFRNAECLEDLTDHGRPRDEGMSDSDPSNRELIVFGVDGRLLTLSDSSGRALTALTGEIWMVGGWPPSEVIAWVRKCGDGFGSLREPLAMVRSKGIVHLRWIARPDDRVWAMAEWSVTEAGIDWHLLTPRERQITLWISKGKSNPEIGLILDIRPRTVEKHVERILAKLGLENRAAIMLTALRNPPPWKLSALAL